MRALKDRKKSLTAAAGANKGAEEIQTGKKGT